MVVTWMGRFRSGAGRSGSAPARLRWPGSAAHRRRGWSEHGPIKLSSRIDVPSGGSVAAGDVVVAGVAWSQHTGISAVQVQVDDGDWNDATLADALNIDTWRQWKWVWPAKAGQHTLRVRATDANGLVQTAKVTGVVPDGATGLDSVSVSVS